MKRIDAIVMGASAGGVAALLSVMACLPKDFAIPLICVLHLPDDHESQLAEVFSRKLGRPVREARDKESIEPGMIYVAGPGYHLSVERDRSLSLSQEDRVHYSRPSIDVLFESASDCYGAALAGVLLTGANEDGPAGLARISEYGGLSIVQDPAQAQVSAMPAAALALHRPDHILPLNGIGHLLAKLESQEC